jgi:hypothetical protein
VTVSHYSFCILLAQLYALCNLVNFKQFGILCVTMGVLAQRKPFVVICVHGVHACVCGGAVSLHNDSL